jgi:hypothetical protein
MKKIVEVTEVSGEGLEALLGQNVLLFCLNYIYLGRLIGVNSDCVLLEDPSIVYETGAFSAKQYGDVQRLHCDKWYVQRAAIESFGVAK